ncbi:baeRF10 domain-containing protein [Bythopirellula polymerisocia]|uniref:Uncharacterized protein n=1 Tax=Bythopirellula polymerisocia TaxID=2528003 RepID=A0A5C6CEJ7_9BACT|nr:hypothetical protein [Bythopirellula polymerisocia]TWU21851.1 hypothetical protein Pla144_45470 [Bythopirellula polymerisocia]
MKKRIQAILDSLRTFIVEHKYEDTPILTAYVGIDSMDQDNRRDRPAWLIELKNEAKRLEEQHGTENLKRRDTRRKWENTEEMIMAHLQDSKPQGRSIVIFTDHEDFLTVDLPIPMKTQLFYGVPQVKPFLFALDSYKKCLVVLFSEQEGKLLEVFLTAPTGEALVQTPSMGSISLRPGGNKSRTQASDRRDLDTERRIVKEKAEEVNAYLLADPEIQHVIFGGNLKLAHAVKNALHPAVSESLVTVEPISYEASNNQTAEIAKRIADEKELEHDLALVNELISRRHACGTAVLETQGVLLALEQGQASKLVVSVPIDSDKFDQLLIKSILNNCEIEFLHGEAAKKLNEFGGIAAVLYYSGK